MSPNQNGLGKEKQAFCDIKQWDCKIFWQVLSFIWKPVPINCDYVDMPSKTELIAQEHIWRCVIITKKVLAIMVLNDELPSHHCRQKLGGGRQILDHSSSKVGPLLPNITFSLTSQYTISNMSWCISGRPILIRLRNGWYARFSCFALKRLVFTSGSSNMQPIQVPPRQWPPIFSLLNPSVRFLLSRCLQTRCCSLLYVKHYHTIFKMVL